jgi:hypothetical protein
MNEKKKNLLSSHLPTRLLPPQKWSTSINQQKHERFNNKLIKKILKNIYERTNCVSTTLTITDRVYYNLNLKKKKRKGKERTE